jgi:hypothetical protein
MSCEHLQICSNIFFHLEFEIFEMVAIVDVVVNSTNVQDSPRSAPIDEG